MFPITNVYKFNKFNKNDKKLIKYPCNNFLIIKPKKYLIVKNNNEYKKNKK